MHDVIRQCEICGEYRHVREFSPGLKECAVCWKARCAAWDRALMSDQSRRIKNLADQEPTDQQLAGQ